MFPANRQEPIQQNRGPPPLVAWNLRARHRQRQRRASRPSFLLGIHRVSVPGPAPPPLQSWQVRCRVHSIRRDDLHTNPARRQPPCNPQSRGRGEKQASENGETCLGFILRSWTARLATYLPWMRRGHELRTREPGSVKPADTRPQPKGGRWLDWPRAILLRLEVVFGRAGGRGQGRRAGVHGSLTSQVTMMRIGTRSTAYHPIIAAAACQIALGTSRALVRTQR